MTDSKPTQKDLEIVLKSILRPHLKLSAPSRIEAAKRVGVAIFGSRFDPLSDAELLTTKVQTMLEDGLCVLRAKWNVEAFDDETTGEEQLQRDFEPKQGELEEYSVLWAHYVHGFSRDEIVRLTPISSRTFDDRLRFGREKLVSLIAETQRLVPRDVPHEPTRLYLLGEVRRAWIEGVYERNLHGRQPIALRLVNRPKTIRGRWLDVVLETAQPEGEQPSGMTVNDAWEKYHNELLVLGTAGVGKTTALLGMLHTLLERAEQDETEPIPVVFHLASWAERREPLPEWLVAEFWGRYRVDPVWSNAAIERCAIVVLLDGLDEVAPEHQVACVAALDAFRATHPMIGIAVCCRSETFAALSPLQMRLTGAVELQPLSPAEVAQQVGVLVDERAATSEPLPLDHPLYELLATPLMLDTYVTTFGTMQPQTLAETTLSAFRRHLFDAYIDQMFKRRTQPQGFSQAETLHTLVWLADEMQQHNDSFFEIERLDSSWLPEDRRLRFVREVRLWRAFVLGIAIGLPATSGLLVVFIEMVAPWLAIRVASWQIAAALALGCASMIALLSVFAVRKITRSSQERIHPVDEVVRSKPIRWSWIVAATFLGIVIAATTNVLYGPVWAAILGGSVVAIFVLLTYLSGQDVRTYQERVVPNQGIRRSGLHALRNGVATLLVVSPTAGLISSLSIGDQPAWIIGPAFGIGIALIMLFYFGGDAWLVHWLLRRTLERQGVIPRKLPELLEFAVERVLMRRVGGRYLFFHGLFQEHLVMRRTTNEERE